jgi:hypothetical protein
MRSLRGGDPRSFYVHPANEWKADKERIGLIRDLVGQGRVPDDQFENWDLCGDSGRWSYPPRAESIVFLVKGRNTPESRIRRCAESLAMQSAQGFGVVVIDDASDSEAASLLPHYFRWLGDRVTLIRHEHRRGRVPNFILAVSQICSDPDTLVAVLDLDDTLFSPRAAGRLLDCGRLGHDVVLSAMFRLDKPTKLYHPDFESPRSKWGGEVWVHLRAFKKRLFDAVPHGYFEDATGAWVEECTDYATMVPIVEIARNPVYLPEYLYLHDRTTPRTPETRDRKDRIIRWLLSMPPLTPESCFPEARVPGAADGHVGQVGRVGQVGLV